ncbi:hypothetical protein Hokovirus_1_81 [Hokovirus HKV1]|uniref:Uncharacterized protein n=1 Tax=Hokovirus HKV1 TaxID=1977638 RepID=A0A1V0SER3_9VIRU|nr:hypothetical protein Hokovirus_1_81 [Hokovirus HKV1]
MEIKNENDIDEYFLTFQSLRILGRRLYEFTACNTKEDVEIIAYGINWLTGGKNIKIIEDLGEEYMEICDPLYGSHKLTRIENFNKHMYVLPILGY